MEVASLIASAVSVCLAIFAIWFSITQRKESQENYNHTKDALNEVEKVMKKTELLVSDNFQNLLHTITNQQGQLLESLRPKKSQEETFAELFTGIMRDDPTKLLEIARAMNSLPGQQRSNP